MYTTYGPAPGTPTSVLVSGGMDSAVVLALAKANSKAYATPHFFHYGQKHAEREQRAAESLCSFYDMRPYKHHVFIPNGFDLEKKAVSGLLPGSWVPGRNLLLMTYAAITLLPDPVIAVGVHQEDQPGYPDCTEEFLLSAEHTLSLALARPIEIWAPLLNMDKARIVSLGIALGVPFELTWSCYAGGLEPCGQCDACVRRARAFELNEFKEETNASN